MGVRVLVDEQMPGGTRQVSLENRLSSGSALTATTVVLDATENERVVSHTVAGPHLVPMNHRPGCVRCWNVVDGFYFAVCTLTTSSIADPSLTLTSEWLKIFTAFYVLTGIGILVEVARQLGVGFVTLRQESREAVHARLHKEDPPKAQ